MALVDELIKRDTQLARSFTAAVAAFLASNLWMLFLAPRGPSGAPDVSLITVLLGLVQLGCYVWYAVSAGAAAGAISLNGWLYVVWILAAPFLALLPIPFVSILIAASPLSIKFLLAGQLQSAIHQETMTSRHGS